VVLDASALLAYARLEGLAVGELLNTVAEDAGTVVGVPAACYLTAYAGLTEPERVHLRRLVTSIEGVTAILPLLGADTVEVADIDTYSVEYAGTGHAVVETRRHGALLATYVGAYARRELPADAVLDLDAE
jgi:hypothetical protein